MDNIVRVYLYSSLLIAILFFVLTSDVLYWVLNRVSTTLYGPTLYSFSAGGPTLSGRVLMSILFFAIIFGVIDYIYSRLNGDDEPTVA